MEKLNIAITNFCEYVEDEELLDYFCYNFETDDLDELVHWLNKQGYTKKDLQEVFSTAENVQLYLYIWEEAHA
jgi:hypothetical protein